MSYAVIKTGGKQYRVQEGQTLLVERLTGDVGSTLELQPLLVAGDGDPVFDGDGLAKLGAVLKPIGPRPAQAGGGLGVESAAAFDFYVQMKAKELGIDVASIPEPPAGGRGGFGGPAPAGAPAGGAGPGGGRGGDPGNPTGMAAISRATSAWL